VPNDRITDFAEQLLDFHEDERDKSESDDLEGQ
jgi:hypothetical protein